MDKENKKNNENAQSTNPITPPMPPGPNPANLNPDPVHPTVPNPSPQQLPQQTGQTPTTNQTDTLGIISLVLIFFIPLVGVIVGIIGLKKAKSGGYKNTLSLIGVIINSLLLVVATVFIALTVFVFSSVETVVKEVEEELQTTQQQKADDIVVDESKRLFFSVPASDSNWDAILLNQDGINSFNSDNAACSITTYQRAGVKSAVSSLGRALLDSIEAQANLSTNNSAKLPLAATGSKKVSLIEGGSVDFEIYETTYNNGVGNFRIYGQWVGDSELMIAVGCLSSEWVGMQGSVDNFVEKIQLTSL